MKSVLKKLFVIFYSSLLYFSMYAVDVTSLVKGSVIASAIGDAMGKVTEFKAPEQIFQVYPNGIRSFNDFKPQDFWLDKNGNYVAPYTDDTAMAKLTLEVLIESRQKTWDLDTTMEELAKAFVKDMHAPKGWTYPERAPGNASMKNTRELERRLTIGIEQWKPTWWKPWTLWQSPWWAVGGLNDGGCGSVMHAFPFGLVFAEDPEKAAKWAVKHSLLTHGAPIAQAACAAMAVGVAYAVRQEKPEICAQKMIEAARAYDHKTADMMEEVVNTASKIPQNLSLQELFEYSKPVFQKFEGWAAHDAIAATLYIFLVSHNDVKKAIYLGVHTPGDSDSLACMAGALVGAYVGIEQLPKDWIKTVEGSEELLNLAFQASQLIT